MYSILKEFEVFIRSAVSDTESMFQDGNKQEMRNHIVPIIDLEMKRIITLNQNLDDNYILTNALSEAKFEGLYGLLS